MLRLADGVTVQEEDDKGKERIYSRPPDRATNEYLINRIMGKPTEVQRIEAEITDRRDDPEFDDLIAAYRGHVPGRAPGHNGEIEPSGLGGGSQSGQVGDGASSEASKPEVSSLHEGHRNGTVTTNGDHNASEAR
jgi:hypothetical protein